MGIAKGLLVTLLAAVAGAFATAVPRAGGEGEMHNPQPAPTSCPTVSVNCPDMGGFDVALDGMNVRANVRGTKYQVGYVSPGPHKVEVSARVGGQTLEASELVNIAPGEIAKATLALPVKKAQP